MPGRRLDRDQSDVFDIASFAGSTAVVVDLSGRPATAKRGGDTVVRASTDADAAAQVETPLSGVTVLAPADFRL